MRVHLSALEKKVGRRFPCEHPVIAWLAEIVGDACTKYLQGADGRTAYERLFGKPVREEALEFGEVVLYRPKKRDDANVLLEDRWAKGVWLGRRWGSPTSRIYSRGGVVDARAVQRVPAEERWCAGTLGAIRATPWCVRPAADVPLVALQPLPPADVVVPPPEPNPEPIPRGPLGYHPRRVFITKADLEVWGYTANCRRCSLMREGSRAQGVAHREECRQRLEQALRDVGDPRVEHAADRRQAAADAAAAGAAPRPAAAATPAAGAAPRPASAAAPAPGTPTAVPSRRLPPLPLSQSRRLPPIFKLAGDLLLRQLLG